MTAGMWKLSSVLTEDLLNLQKKVFFSNFLGELTEIAPFFFLSMTLIMSVWLGNIISINPMNDTEGALTLQILELSEIFLLRENQSR